MYNNIEMIQVASSNVESVGYDEQEEIIMVKFLNGSEYIYKNVSNPIVFEELVNAPSVGAYLNRNIKGVYPYEKI
ncbi:KTSC domain-containing protein [Clostridium tagluense]|uniref:KTSC domain-containing protein n=1 Tax=Clostridium tagluense TaxID=360422 RepID=A0A401UNG9_9CLOT|nr:KTSC domain-containing protein [Clostridium tagluense]GCD11086.1 KTSC domain-containing protein [Clostridium tagluense]